MADKQTVPYLIISILIGAAIGLVYGWVIKPIQPAGCTPDTFRSEYRADYVLMAAESYAGDQDSGLALQRLKALSPGNPALSIAEAITFGRSHQFSTSDMQLLEQLAEDLSSQGLLAPEEIGVLP